MRTRSANRLATAAFALTLLVTGAAQATPTTGSIPPPVTGTSPRPPIQPPHSRPEVKGPPPPAEDLPAGFSSWETLFAEQQKLNAVADRIVAAGSAGFAGLIADPTNREVRLYWKGTLPAAVADAVTLGRLQAPVSVFSAPYSEAELEVEAQRWIDSGLATDAYPKSDGTGVTVEAAGEARAGGPELPGGSRTAFTAEYGHGRWASLAAEPAVTSEQPAVAYWRWNDTAPRWGGSRFYADGHANCTAGFPVIDFEGYPGMLIAGHCGTVGKKVQSPFGGAKFGEVWWDWDYHDVAAVWVYDSVQGNVYVGPWNSSYSRPVAAAASNYTGNYVCVSGSTTGSNCAIRVYYRSPSDVTIRAERSKNGACAAAPGDSGGPVIEDYQSLAYGKGILSAGSDSVTCWVGGTAIGGYHRILYKGLKFTLNATGSTLKTMYN
jgi:hypothetical protein